MSLILYVFVIYMYFVYQVVNGLGDNLEDQQVADCEQVPRLVVTVTLRTKCGKYIQYRSV